MQMLLDGAMKIIGALILRCGAHKIELSFEISDCRYSGKKKNAGSPVLELTEHFEPKSSDAQKRKSKSK